VTLLRRAQTWWGVVPAVLLVLIVWPKHAFVPIWDGNVYLQCVVHAAADGLNVHSLRCGGHQSQLYMGLLALTQLARPGNLAAIVAMNLALAMAALAAFNAILRRLIPGAEFWAERALLVSIIAIQPLLAATLVQLNSDFGVYVFFAMSLAALVWRRYWLVAVAGLMLCFSKETGALIYCAALGLHVLFRAIEARRDGKDGAAVTAVAVESWPALLPLIAFGGFLAWWGATQHSYAIWNQGIHEHPAAGMHWFDFDDVILRSYAAIIFVLGFAWISTSAILADVAVGAARVFRKLADRPLHGMDVQLAGFLAALTALLVYLLTVYRTWSFPRYFAVLAPLLLLAGFISLVRLGAGPRVRRSALAAVAIALFSANYVSRDPVSRALFGTLSLGESTVYDVSGIAHDFRVIDADHLCYNLQFTGFHWALNAMYAQLKPTAQTTIVFPRFNRWGLWAPLDPHSFERVARLTDTVSPDYADEAAIAARRDRMPHELWLVEQPNDGDTTAVQKLHHDYTDADSARYTAHGVTITARHLVRRDAAVLPSGERRQMKVRARPVNTSGITPEAR
jgi:hypothetical protein